MRCLALALVLSFAPSALAKPFAMRKYADVKATLQSLGTQYKTTTTLFDLGPSDSGETIQGIRVGVGPVKNLVVGTHHGNEYGSTEVALAFAEAVAKNPITGQTVYVIPVLNIGGYDQRRRNETALGRAYDPNRDYPGPCGTEGPFKLKSTAALAAFLARENITASATLHTFAPAVLWPWGLSAKDPETIYKPTFEMLSRAATEESRYTIGNSKIVLYPADGTFEDYAFWKHGIWSLLFELGGSHYPSDDDVKEMIRVNLPGLRRMLETAPTARAPDHEFKGVCDASLRALDRHAE